MSTPDLLERTDVKVAAPPHEEQASPVVSRSVLVRTAIRTAAHPQLRRGVLTLVDQAAVSGTNFVTTVLLGRMCLQEELGLYALGFSVIEFLGGMSAALLWLPYTFNSAHLRGGRLTRHTGAVTVHMAVFCLLTALGLLTASGISALRGDTPALSGLFAVLAVAGSLMLFREYVRRVYLAQMRVGSALMLNLGMAAVQLSGLAFVVWQGVLSARSAYGVAAVACGLLTLIWLAAERRRLIVRRPDIWDTWRRNWSAGRWIFSANMVRFLAKDIYPWVLAAFHGLPAVAVLAAARGVIFFANPFLIGIANFAGPFAAHAYADHGPDGLRRKVVFGTIGIAAVMGGFCAVVSIWGGAFVQLLYGPRYAGEAHVVAAVAIGQLIEALGLPVGFGLLAVHRADYELKAAIVQLVVMVCVGIWLVRFFGPAGVGYGFAAAYLASGAVKWMAFARILRNV